MYTGSVSEFVCKVADASGRVFSQVEAAQSITEARQQLSERGLYVYSVSPRRDFLGQLSRRRRHRAVAGSDFLIFNQQFNTLVKAGLPILKALDLLAERAGSPKLRPALADVRDRVRNGSMLSEAFEQQGMFPKVYTTAILAGEKSGNLSGVLDYYIAYQQVTTGVRKKLIATLIYPIILVSFATLVLTYIITYVIPQFTKLYRELNIELPYPTRLLISFTEAFRSYVLLVLLVVVIVAALAYSWSRSVAGGVALDRIRLRLPLIGPTWIKFQLAQFTRTLSTLQVGGTPLVAALDTAADAISSKLVRRSIHEAAQKVREGQSLHAAFSSTGIIPELALEMIEVGEASGALAQMLNSVAEFYEQEVNMRLATLVAIVEPAILIFMGFVVAFILISLYLPIFSVSIGTVGR
jgi:type IV pilus assembly protein PilC